ncbi:MAG: prolipoprotein diacylglyceryl transferase [Bacillota bacterium]
MVNPDRVAFNLFGKDIYWYGVLMAVGILVAVFFAIRESKRKKLHDDTILDLCLIIIPLGVIGARLYYVLFELDQYIKNPIKILYVWEGGLAIFGAVLGGLLGLWLYSRRKKIRFLKLADCIAPGLALAQAIGRWGNFFNQEAYGLPVTDPNLLWFPLAVKIDAPWLPYHMFNGEICSNPYHLATFFYESVWCFLIFITLWSMRKRFKHDGDAFVLYLILYGFERMFIEGLRGDSLWLIPDVIRVSQLLSALLFIAGVVFLLVRRNREKKLGVLCWPKPEAAAEPEPQAAGDVEAAEQIGREQSKAEENDQAGEQEPLPAHEDAAEAQEPDDASKRDDTAQD